VFDLNGTFKDNGSARPRITVVNDVLTVDLSSQNRPPAYGLVFDDHTILVIFPDINAWFRGTLVAPGTILWSNNTIWQKLPYVPNVIGQPMNDASAALKAAGFRVRTTQSRPICSGNSWFVTQQTPAGNTQADPGSKVRITVSNC
jgi:PASTA domain-containing protein